MKKVIGLLEQTEAKIMLVTASPGFDDEELCNEAVNLINEVMAELKAPLRPNSEGDRRVQCNWCMSVFGEEHIKVVDDEEYCPICGETGYLMDISEEEAPPRWETPEQWEKRTGKAWPENAAVRVLLPNKEWDLMEHWRAEQLRRDLARLDKDFGDEPEGLLIVCDRGEAGPPPNDWRPEEDK
jgi:hypothetical protein